MTHRDCSLTDRSMSYIGAGKFTEDFAGESDLQDGHLSVAL
jgi:hypothetical protein